MGVCATARLATSGRGRVVYWSGFSWCDFAFVAQLDRAPSFQSYDYHGDGGPEFKPRREYAQHATCSIYWSLTEVEPEGTPFCVLGSSHAIVCHAPLPPPVFLAMLTT